MSFEQRSTSDLVRIASAGGGFRLSATHRSTEDLVSIAAAGSSKGARITFTGLAHFSTEDLVWLASAGKGCVVLEG